MKLEEKILYTNHKKLLLKKKKKHTHLLGESSSGIIYIPGSPFAARGCV